MEITLHKQNEAVNPEGVPVILWKFIDQDGKLWATETAIDGTEQEAASIILGSMQSA